MTTFGLIPGADGRAWFWHLLVPALRSRGHDAVAVDLPLAGTAGLTEYADAAVEALRDRTDLVLVGHSLGAYTAPLVCERLPMELLVLLNPMVPTPGESPGDWWANTGQSEARVRQAERDGRSPEFDLRTDFFHDVPPDVTEQAFVGEGAALDTLFSRPWPLTAWPDVPIRFLQGRDDRFFPLEFQRRIARERLGIHDIDEMPGGHLLALSRPDELADRLVAYLGR
ncbi:alpha/beta hydrolase [Streptosporangium sp. KLBMP 9127]|nr:alpha/beta hydrolase [Streptosporangium sp. KLBMP 9127]